MNYVHLKAGVTELLRERERPPQGGAGLGRAGADHLKRDPASSLQHHFLVAAEQPGLIEPLNRPLGPSVGFA